MAVSAETFYGGAQATSISADHNLIPGMSRVQILTPGATTGLKAKLAPAPGFDTGGVIFWVVNKGTASIVVANTSGTTLATLNQDQVGEITLVDNATNDGLWFVKVKTVSSAINPLPDDYHYFAGGQYSDSNPGAEFVSPNYKRTREYNQQLDIFSVKTDAPTAFVRGASYRYSDKLHYPGGYNPNQVTILTVHQEYDPDSWTTLTALPTGFAAHAGAYIGALGYIFGGAGTGSPTVRTYEYSGSWTVKTARAAGRGLAECGAATVGSTIYLTGGGSNSNLCDSYVSDLYTVLQTRPLPFCYTNGVAVAGGLVFSFGGADFTTYYPSVTAFDPTNGPIGTWVVKQPFFGGGARRVGASSVNDVIQLMGGQPRGPARDTGYPGAYFSADGSRQNIAYDYLTDTYATRQSLGAGLTYAPNHHQACTR